MSESSKAKFLEKNATPQQLEMGADLADWVVGKHPTKCIL